MTIYVLSLNDDGIYAAYATFSQAKATLWKLYCNDIDEKIRLRYEDEDKKTLEEGYIIDYGFITETELVQEKI